MMVSFSVSYKAKTPENDLSGVFILVNCHCRLSLTDTQTFLLYLLYGLFPVRS